MEPHLATQVTGTLAVNCWVWPWGVLALAGVITMGETSWTVVEVLPLPLFAFAVTVQVPG